MKKVTVLGCGLVGFLMVRDLALDGEYEVVVADLAEENLARAREFPRVTARRADLSSRGEIETVIETADVVVGAVPGRLGLAMLETVIEAGKPIADISFAPEDPLGLDERAKAAGVTAVVDCGVSPGLSNLAIGRAASQLDEVDDVVIFVGGLPAVRYWPFEYRSVFSPTDVIEEYLRPARFIEGGEIVVREALSEVELIDFPGIGTLEAFNTDGLRTVMSTVRGRNMKEKTLRYPGHAERMRMLRETGFFSDQPVRAGGVEVVPRRLTETLLFDNWQRPEGEDELTLLQVTVSGRSGGEAKTFTYHLLDRTDHETGATSMARTTGFPCVIMARMLAEGRYRSPGVRPPELFGGDEPLWLEMLEQLGARGVDLVETRE
jgi:lysine 6-dehydrogenase